MKLFFKNIINYFIGQPEIPEDFRENFKHYYLDISWYALLNGSTLSFLNYFAVHEGASTYQIGLITAAPAIISLIFSLPAGVLLGKRSNNTRAAFITSVFTRIFYLLFIFLPFFKSGPFQIWMIIAVTLIMNIPGIFTNVSFNTAFAENIPDQYRAHVAGLRNAFFAIITTLISLLSGILLKYIPFPYGYSFVFAVGFLGAAMSSYQLYRIRPLQRFDPPLQHPVVQTIKIPFKQLFHNGIHSFRKQIKFNLLVGRTGIVLVLLWLLNFSVNLSAPVFPEYVVEVFRFNDQTISIAMALYYFTMFVGSLFLERFERRMGRKKVVAVGMLFISTYPLFLLLTKGPLFYFVANMASGFGWGLTGADIFNYLYENLHEEDRTPGVAWYTLGVNAAVLLGSMLGPLIANHYSVVTTLIIFVVVRFAVSFAILRWG